MVNTCIVVGVKTMSKSASSVVEWKRVTMVSTAKLYYDVSVRIVFCKRSKSKLTDILPNFKCFLQRSSHGRRRDLLRWLRNVNTVRQVLQLNCEILIMLNVSLCLPNVYNEVQAYTLLHIW